MGSATSTPDPVHNSRHARRNELVAEQAAPGAIADADSLEDESAFAFDAAKKASFQRAEAEQTSTSSTAVEADFEEAEFYREQGLNDQARRLYQRVLEVVRHFANEKKPIASICHGAQVLAAAGVLKGKSCAAYPAVGPDVTASGGTYVDIPVDQAYTHENLVSAPAWPAHPDWLAQFLKLLGTKIEL